MTRAVDEMIDRFKHNNEMRHLKAAGEDWVSLHTQITQDYLKAVIDAAIFHRDKRYMDIRWIE